MTTFTARWVFPGDQPPIAHGRLTIDGDNIVSIRPDGPYQLDLGNVAILPGFVNAHTHLDLTAMRGKCPPTPDFVGWLRGVIAHRRAQTPEQIQHDIAQGIAECQRFGTTLVGDIASGGASWDMLSKASISSVVYREILGLSLERARQELADAGEWLFTRPGSSHAMPGISPHAPYSVRESLFSDVAILARGYEREYPALPIAIHLAESEAEIELLRVRAGPFRKFLEDLGLWEHHNSLANGFHNILQLYPEPYLLAMVHANFLQPAGTANRPVIYCPRTHHAFGHPQPHPFRLFLDAGQKVALGTDSLASNPDLDILAEARWVRRQHPNLPGETLLRMLTLWGAEVLGWGDRTGSLTPGKYADFVVMPLSNAPDSDPHELIFSSTLPVRNVNWRGRWVSPLPAPAPLNV